MKTVTLQGDRFIWRTRFVMVCLRDTRKHAERGEKQKTATSQELPLHNVPPYEPRDFARVAHYVIKVVADRATIPRVLGCPSYRSLTMSRAVQSQEFAWRKRSDGHDFAANELDLRRFFEGLLVSHAKAPCDDLRSARYSQLPNQINGSSRRVFFISPFARRRAYDAPIRHISLSALKVALADLFDKRLGSWLASNAGKMYEPVLRDKKARIDALPEALTGGRPLAEALSDADDAHDGFGSAIWFVTEAYLRWPDIPADVRAAIERIRAAFIPDVDLLRAPYAEEVDAATHHKADLVKLESDLRSIPIAGGLSLYDWCAGFVAKGESIGTLLSQRADMTAQSRAEAGKLRAETMGVLRRMRAALVDEMSVNPNLPADLEAKVFGYFDELNKMAANAAAARKKPADPGASGPTG